MGHSTSFMRARLLKYSGTKYESRPPTFDAATWRMLVYGDISTRPATLNLLARYVAGPEPSERPRIIMLDNVVHVSANLITCSASFKIFYSVGPKPELAPRACSS